MSDASSRPDAPPVPAPGGLAAERERELAVIERVAGDLADVDRALGRLDDGSYGTCEACGAALDDDRLAADPVARWCDEHRPGPDPGQSWSTLIQI